MTTKRHDRFIVSRSLCMVLFTIFLVCIFCGHAGSELLISLQPVSGVLYAWNSCCMSVWSPKPNFPRATLPRPKHAGSTCGQSHAYKFLHYANRMLRASALNLSELRLSQCTIIFKAFRENLFKMWTNWRCAILIHQSPGACRSNKLPQLYCKQSTSMRYCNLSSPGARIIYQSLSLFWFIVNRWPPVVNKEPNCTRI